jgi:hypothetical protein
VKWPKSAAVVQTASHGSVRLDPNTPWADDADVVRERPDLFDDEPGVPLRGGRIVETARQAPGQGRITGVKRSAGR